MTIINFYYIIALGAVGDTLSKPPAVQALVVLNVDCLLFPRRMSLDENSPKNSFGTNGTRFSTSSGTYTYYSQVIIFNNE